MSSVTCTICDTPLPPFASAGPPLCGAMACRWKYQNLPKQQLCQVCGRTLSHNDRAAGACTDRACWVTLNQQRQRVRVAELEADAEELRDVALAQFPQLHARSIPLTIIPAYSGQTTRVQRRRREAFRRRLTWVLQEKDDQPLAGNHPPVQVPGAIAPVAEAACTTCKGNCCRNGNDHAYLTATTMGRVKANHPDWSEEQIVGAYLSRVGPRSYHNSCIFHTATGCGLPREMRSDTCNNYFCDPMRGFLTIAIHEPAAPAFLVSIESSTVRAGLLFDGEKVETVRPGG